MGNKNVSVTDAFFLGSYAKPQTGQCSLSSTPANEASRTWRTGGQSRDRHVPTRSSATTPVPLTHVPLVRGRGREGKVPCVPLRRAMCSSLQFAEPRPRKRSRGGGEESTEIPSLDDGLR